MSNNHIHWFVSKSKQILAMQATIKFTYGHSSNPGNENDQNQAFNVEDVIDDGNCYFRFMKCIGMKRRTVV